MVEPAVWTAPLPGGREDVEAADAGMADEVEASLSRARELIDTAMRHHGRPAGPRGVVEVAGDRRTASAQRRRLVAAAGEEVLYVPVAGTAGRDGVHDVLDAAGGRIAVRVLYAADPVAVEDLAALHEAGAQARVCAWTLPELLVTDGRRALVRLAERQALLVTAPALVAAVVALGEQAWRAGSSPAGGRDGLTAAILAALTAGHKDAAAARQLGLSVRQYRRHVAEIMQELGAASRFQAGARAAERGLLPPAAASRRPDQPVIPPSTGKTPPVR